MLTLAEAGFGTAEVGVGMGLLLSCFVGLLTWVGKDAKKDLEFTKKLVNELVTELAVVKSMVPDHGSRIVTLEKDLADLKSDVREVNSTTKQILRILDRRHDDRDFDGADRRHTG
jgi:hypothetical protein